MKVNFVKVVNVLVIKYEFRLKSFMDIYIL